MTPPGHIRRDLRTDNQGGLRVVIEEIEHLITRAGSTSRRRSRSARSGQGGWISARW